jgi:hypothetical protein
MTKWKIKDYSNDPDEYMYPHIIHSRPGRIGGDRVYCEALEIMEGFRSSGSGIGAFGEIKEWGYVELRMDFPENRLDARGKFAGELKDFVDKFLQENDLETD